MPSLAEQIIPKRKLLLLASEFILLSSVVFVGTSIVPLADGSFDLEASDWGRQVLSSLLVALMCQAALSINDLYDWKVSQNRRELPHRLLHAAGYAIIALAIVAFVFQDLLKFPSIGKLSEETWKLGVLVALGFLTVGAWRLGFHWFFYRWNFGERVLVLGAGPRARMIASLIEDHPISGFEPVGLVASDRDTVPSEDENRALPQGQRVVGKADDLADLADDLRVSRVVVALEERRGKLPVSALLNARMQGVRIEEKEAMFERVAGKIAVESLRPSYLIYGGGFSKNRVVLVGKRTIDLIASVLGLLISAPVCLIAAGLIKLDSRGPVFFSQERVGEDGESFNILKFRTMTVDAEKDGPVWAKTGDKRITRIGRFLRLSRIDEIPQMINVLRGDMSFVGPRPERPVFVEQLSEEIPFYPLRHTTKPGLTGWAQVNYPYGASVEDAAEKLRYDLYYIKNMNPLFDLNIILRTVGVILFGKGAR
ncbi:MAG: TIGR03013 family XrtA/PEP-CTERM system glycosyltransferase [Planctomycetota bacterium]